MSGSSPPEAMTSALASLAHSSAPDACWSAASPPAWSGCGSGVEQHFDVLDVEAELRDAGHDHRRGGGIAAVEHDVALGPGDEEGRDVVRADVVEIAGDAERFGGLLPVAVCVGLPLPAEEHGGGGAQSEHEDQHVSPGEVRGICIVNCRRAAAAWQLAGGITKRGG